MKGTMTGEQKEALLDSVERVLKDMAQNADELHRYMMKEPRLPKSMRDQCQVLKDGFDAAMTEAFTEILREREEGELP